MAEARSIRPEVVVKVGGSLFGNPGRLRDVLGILSQAGIPLVIVPGGGPFADAVRAAQSGLGFSEPCAHELAILAMRQTARIFSDLQTGFVIADRLSHANSVLEAGGVPLLVPRAELIEDASFPKTWEATSDAIAAWVGVRLKARKVVFVKSRRAPGAWGVGDLADAGIVDRVSATILAGSGIAAIVVGPGEDDALAKAVGRASPV